MPEVQWHREGSGYVYILTRWTLYKHLMDLGVEAHDAWVCLAMQIRVVFEELALQKHRQPGRVPSGEELSVSVLHFAFPCFTH